MFFLQKHLHRVTADFWRACQLRFLHNSWNYVRNSTTFRLLLQARSEVRIVILPTTIFSPTFCLVFNPVNLPFNEIFVTLRMFTVREGQAWVSLSSPSVWRLYLLIYANRRETIISVGVCIAKMCFLPLIFLNWKRIVHEQSAFVGIISSKAYF
jgi:hypothetical protein